MKRYLTSGEIAEHLGISRVTAYLWIRDGKLKAHRTIGGRYRVAPDDFARFLKSSGMTHLLPRGAAGFVSFRVLIVDDDGRVVEVLQRHIASVDPRVETLGVTSGFEAGRQMAVFKPDVVLLDLRMPDLDGFDVCRAIKADPATRHVTVIAMTGFPGERDVRRIMDAGAETCLAKPDIYREAKRIVGKLARERFAAAAPGGRQ